MPAGHLVPAPRPSPEEVSGALATWLSARFGGPVGDAAAPSSLTGGYDFWIYLLHLRGEHLPPEWTAPVVARVSPRAERYPFLVRENGIQEKVTAQGYPAPAVRALMAPGEMLDQPVQLIAWVRGRPMAERMTASPWRIPGLVDRLADLQARLHRLPQPASIPTPILNAAPPRDRGTEAADDVPSSLFDQRLFLVRWVLEQRDDPDLAAALAQAEGLRPRLEVTDPVLCHGDFHPMNVLVEADDCFVIDWTDAAPGDRHGDIARTAWLFHFAAAAAPHRRERMVMRSLAPYLSRRYLSCYRRRLPVDDRRLQLWMPLQLIHAWALLVADGAELTGPSRAGQQYRRGLLDWVVAGFQESMQGCVL